MIGNTPVALDSLPCAREILRDLDSADSTPPLYLIRGRSGTGKSTLLSAIRARLQLRGITVTDRPGDVVPQLRGLTNDRAGDVAATPDNSRDTVTGSTSDADPTAAEPSPAGRRDGTTQPRNRSAVDQLVVAAVAGAASTSNGADALRHSYALVVDDAHGLTADELELLYTAADSAACAVIVASRPRPHDTRTRAFADLVSRRGRVVDLRALGVTEIAPFARELGMMVPRGLAQHIHRQTDGIHGGVVAALSAACATRLDAGVAAVDKAVTAWARTRLDDADPDLLDTFVVAALGAGLDASELIEVLDVSPSVAQDLVDRARAGALITDADLLLSPAVAPLRTLVGDRRFLAVQRKLLQARLDAGLLRDHTALLLAEAGVRDPRLAEFLCTAAEKAGDEAVRYYAAAAAAGADSTAIAVRWADAAARAGDCDAAIRLAEPALARPETPPADLTAAVRICAGVWARRGLTTRAAQLYTWLGAHRVGADWAIGAAVLYLAGDAEAARALSSSSAHWPPTEANARAALIAEALAGSTETPPSNGLPAASAPTGRRGDHTTAATVPVTATNAPVTAPGSFSRPTAPPGPLPDVTGVSPLGQSSPASNSIGSTFGIDSAPREATAPDSDRAPRANGSSRATVESATTSAAPSATTFGFAPTANGRNSSGHATIARGGAPGAHDDDSFGRAATAPGLAPSSRDGRSSGPTASAAGFDRSNGGDDTADHTVTARGSGPTVRNSVEVESASSAGTFSHALPGAGFEPGVRVVPALTVPTPPNALDMTAPQGIPAITPESATPGEHRRTQLPAVSDARRTAAVAAASALIGAAHYSSAPGDRFLPCSAVSIATLLCLSMGEPRRAADALRGAGQDPQHRVLGAWVAMLGGDEQSAAAIIADLDVAQLDPRDRLLAHGVIVGLARRSGDHTALTLAWQAAYPLFDEVGADLLGLLPIGELWLASIRLRDEGRVSALVGAAAEVLARLGEPPAWANAFHWYAIQAAIAHENPNELLPHAHRLKAAAEAGDPQAAALADAGRTWVLVLRGQVARGPVEAAVHRLAALGLIWDAARLASEAALAADDSATATALLKLARTIRAQARPPEGAAIRPPVPADPAPRPEPVIETVLSEREREVAELVLLGLTYREIGARLYISAKTVEHHVARIRRRIGAGSRSELLSMLRAMGHGSLLV